MTEPGSALDTAVLGELRESVGDDPEFLAELMDDFLADAPETGDALEIDDIARGAPLTIASALHTR